MVGLLGQRDELLRLIEAAFPAADIHIRGNEISVSGDEAMEMAHDYNRRLKQRYGLADRPAETLPAPAPQKEDRRATESQLSLGL